MPIPCLRVMHEKRKNSLKRSVQIGQDVRSQQLQHVLDRLVHPRRRTAQQEDDKVVQLLRVRPCEHVERLGHVLDRRCRHVCQREQELAECEDVVLLERADVGVRPVGDDVEQTAAV